MLISYFLVPALLSATGVSISEPVDGETYNGDWLPLRVIVENENELPDSVQYTLNGQAVVQIPRLNTDWPTYMQNYQNHGYSEAPAPHDNTILWAAPVTGYIHEFPTPVVVDGIVYYPQNRTGDSLFALNAATGECIWKYKVGDTDDAATVVDERLYVASDSLFCLDALTGERIWATSEADWVGSTPIVVGNRVFAGRRADPPPYGGVVSCFDTSSGEMLWSTFLLDGSLISCMGLWNNNLIIPTYHNNYYASIYLLDSNTGSIIWENTDAYEGYRDSSPVIVDNCMYIGGEDGALRAIDCAFGNTIWVSETFTQDDFIAATPAFHLNRLYFADQVASFHCVDALTGSSLWSVSGTQHGSSAVADDKVFFGECPYLEDSASVVALDIATGAEVWSYRTACSLYGFQGSPSVTDGVMYYPCTDGFLYAFGTGLKYTYQEDFFYAEVGANDLIVTSYDDGAVVAADTISFTVTQTGINLEPSRVFKLSASPNPFRSSSAITFELREQGTVSLQVFDLTGREVVSLVDQEVLQGEHSVQWDGCSENRQPVSAGLYLCRIESGCAAETTGLCLLR